MKAQPAKAKRLVAKQTIDNSKFATRLRKALGTIVEASDALFNTLDTPFDRELVALIVSANARELLAAFESNDKKSNEHAAAAAEAREGIKDLDAKRTAYIAEQDRKAKEQKREAAKAAKANKPAKSAAKKSPKK